MSDRDAPSGAEAPGPGPETKAAPAAPADPGHAAGNGASPAAGAPAPRPADPPPDTPTPSRPGGADSTPAPRGNNAGSPEPAGNTPAPVKSNADSTAAGGGEKADPASSGGSVAAGVGGSSGGGSGTASDAPTGDAAPASRGASSATDADASAPGGDGEEGTPARKPRRRGSRGGRKRNKARSEGGAQGAGDGEAAQAADRTTEASKSGGGAAAARAADTGKASAGGDRAAVTAAGEGEGAGDGAASTDDPNAGGEGGKSGRRRRRRGGGSSDKSDKSDKAAAERAGETDGTGSGSGDGGSDAASDPASDPRTPELPDLPREGRPSSVKAAARALVPKIPPPRPKPKIGDSIPPEALRQGADGNGGKDGKDGNGKDGNGGKQAGKKGQADTATGEGGKKRRRRRGGRGKGSGSRESTQPIEATLPAGVELDEATLERRKGRERKGRPVGRYSMCVHVTEKATQIAVLEGRALIEHYVSRPSDDISQIHGNIYLGRVQNVLPGMEAAFVDIGTPKNAVLYRGDVHYDPEDVERRGQTPRIEDMLKAGQTIVCQVTKNPIGAKGARLTQEVSLPGRFVVLIPNSSTYGISKRLPDDERKRLRQILDRVKPAEHGIIVRTAAQNVTSEEIADDVLRLADQWKKIDALAKRSKAASLLYREPDMAVRVIREEFNQDYRNVAIDDPELFEAVRDYVTSISPELADRVELYDPSKEDLPLFERYHVHEQLHKALDRKVWLPSGGSLIIEHTEALTVIDVNTGKNVGRSSLEETVFKNNLEAAVEIARQLRLRDIGGIIVIDFIDMERKDNRDEVVKVFRDALSRDKTRTQVFDISELGLCEMTRKRIGEGLLESFAQQCPVCEGRGVTIDEELLPT